MTAVTANDTAAARSVWTAPVAAYAAFAVAAVLLLHPTMFDMAAIWATSSSYRHGFVVAPIALWMILDRRASAPPPRASAWSLIGVFTAAALWLMGRAAGAAIVEQLAFIALLAAGVGAIFGMAMLRHGSFAFVFLVFMVPFGETLIPFLQTITAKAAVALLDFFGVNATLDGYLIRTSAGSFEIAEACAGLNFLLAAVMISAMFAYLSFQTWRKRVFFLTLAVLIALGANGLRAFFLILIATLTDMRWAIGPDHVIFGTVFYAAVFAAQFWIGSRFSDQPKRRVAASAPSRPWRFLFVAPAFAIMAAAALYAHLVVDRPISRTAPATLSLISAPGWRILPPPQNWRAELAAADRTAAAAYVSEDRTIYASIGYFTHDRRDAEIVNYANRAWDGDYWRRIASAKGATFLFGRSGETHLDILAGPDRRRLAVAKAYWWNGEIFFEPQRMKTAQMKAKLAGANPPGGVILIAAAFETDPEDAIAAMRAFAADAEPLTAWLARNDRQ